MAYTRSGYGRRRVTSRRSAARPRAGGRRRSAGGRRVNAAPQTLKIVIEQMPASGVARVGPTMPSKPNGKAKF